MGNMEIKQPTYKNRIKKFLIENSSDILLTNKYKSA